MLRGSRVSHADVAGQAIETKILLKACEGFRFVREDAMLLPELEARLMASPKSKRELRFGAFELDPDGAELRKHGLRIKLQDQPLKVLIALLERPGEIVTREDLRDRLWGTGTFVDYEHGLSAAVNRLREALADSPENPRFVETMARRGYRFIAPVDDTSRTVPSVGASPKRHLKVTVGIAVVFLTAGGAGLWSTRTRFVPSPPKVVQLTAYSGSESHPTFSPDGKQIAFAWDGEKQDNYDLYVKAAGDSPARRLTTDAAFDGFPAWAPDGDRIAFVRLSEKSGLYLISPFGGPEQKLADFPTLSRITWSPDGQYLVAAKLHQEEENVDGEGSLYAIPVGTGRTLHPILRSPSGTWYVNPAFSPDGRSLAFAACRGSNLEPGCTLNIAGVERESILSGPIRQVAEPSPLNIGLAWTADASSLIFSTLKSGGTRAYLWRVGVAAGSRPERLDLAGPAAFYPAVDPAGHRLAYSQDITLADSDIFRIQLGGKPSLLLTSSARDANPQYSPDGHYIAFESGRGTESYSTIWIAKADGTEPRQVVKFRSGTPRWSPDGQWLAFDSFENTGRFGVWVVEASGGTPRRLTNHPEDDVIPSWSQDGAHVYFGSKRSGRFEIWRVLVTGGDAVQITRHGGLVAFETADGKSLCYLANDSGGGLYRKTLPDGDERQLFSETIAARGFAVFSDGVYYLHPTAKIETEIRFYEFSRGDSSLITEIEGPLTDGLAVSPDRRSFLLSSTPNKGKDLMLIENFR
jgi:Tol biopolymer transport system component/DNA-binding winged helix-turn-helix (wHTH) protein